MTQNETSTAITVKSVDLCNKSINLSKILKNQADSSDYVSHVTPGDVRLMCIAAAATKKQSGKTKQSGERTAALIRLIFDGCLRVSEALQSECAISPKRRPVGW